MSNAWAGALGIMVPVALARVGTPPSLARSADLLRTAETAGHEHVLVVLFGPTVHCTSCCLRMVWTIKRELGVLDEACACLGGFGCASLRARDGGRMGPVEGGEVVEIQM